MFFGRIVIEATLELEDLFRAIRLTNLIIVVNDCFSLQVKLLAFWPEYHVFGLTDVDSARSIGSSWIFRL